MSHVTNTNESYREYTSHIRMHHYIVTCTQTRHAAYMHKGGGHGTHTNESYETYKWVAHMSEIYARIG